MDIFAFSRDNRSSQRRASVAELVELLRLCFSRTSRLYLILDGIDECLEDRSLIQTLLKLSTCSPVKILLFSRLNVASLTKRVKLAQRLQLGRSALVTDIRCYFLNRLAALIEDGLLPQVEPSALVDQLVRGADGMFLWAKLMVDYLDSPALTPRKRLATIQEVIFPEGLERMYDRILALIAKRGKTERCLAGQIFC
jgi:hypothetical protein